ncbi:SRPBCC family protein [Amycolatopsis cihanbeyliensis]|uniref:Carbon monoxide dehydrogenase subunit G n=1 Tax=Amycolatopsis cihanbeyliensis TaxID=1128664 RepID=A0A542CUB3_AMYCI|nr:SRPBCC family protein [Amycolatopsis cihanbeyliensis]TQI94394.1 carbon monoxide dehydrogenase subunit G [Amycolatopsis cihanbeyliensis]
MQLEHEFTVPAGIDEVWQAVLDPQRVAPCMPGATLAEADGDTFRGTVKVKLGPVSLLYKGSGEFVEKDEQARKVVITASGKDARGAGTAKATVTVTLTGDGGSTKGSVVTDLSVTGKPAQFGRGMIAEVGGKILDDFATCLGEKLGAAEPEPATAAPEETPRPAAEKHTDAEVIDLFGYAGKSVAKRLIPVAAGALALLALFMIARGLRRRK